MHSKFVPPSVATSVATCVATLTRAAGAAALALGAAACSAEAPKDPPAAGGEAAKPAAAPKDDRSAWPKTLRVSAIPDAQPNAMSATYEPFAAYLSKELGIPVTYTAVTDYQATVTGLASKQLELVWYGGYTSVQADRESKGNAQRICMREEDKHFKSVFVANPASGIKTLADLRGKKFTFGSNSSTSGHLMPRTFLMAAGIQPEKDFAQVAYQKNHDATAQAVEAGTVDAGALNFLRWQQLVDEKKLDTAKVAVFHTSPEYVDYCWSARRDLPEGLKDAIRKAFLALDPANPEHKKLLDAHKASKYVAANDADWKGIEDAAKAAGLLKD